MPAWSNGSDEWLDGMLEKLFQYDETKDRIMHRCEEGIWYEYRKKDGIVTKTELPWEETE